MVLAAGVVTEADVGDGAGLLNLDRSPVGLFAEAPFRTRPLLTVGDGIYLAGCCRGPEDTPDTAAQAQTAGRRPLWHCD